MSDTATASVPLHFTGRSANAARHVLESTPIGVALSWSEIHDEGRVILDVPAHAGYLSRGEQALLDLLRSLSGGGDVNLLAFVDAVDRDCALALVDAVRLLVGEDAGDLDEPSRPVLGVVEYDERSAIVLDLDDVTLRGVLSRYLRVPPHEISSATVERFENAVTQGGES